MRYEARDHTFVLCAYGNSPYLEDALVSIEQQSVLGNILVSTSTLNEHIGEICARHDVELVVNQKDPSIARDWNFGYNHASTKLVTIAHQDDVYESDYLEKVLVAFNRQGSKPGVVHTDYYEIRNGRKVSNNGLLRLKRVMNKLFARGLEKGNRKAKVRRFAFGDPICCPSVTFEKDICGESVFDEGFVNSCDYRTWVQLAQRDISFVFVPEPLMGHRIYAESTTSKNIESSARSNEDLEVLTALWPAPIARIVFAVYRLSQFSNRV